MPNLIVFSDTKLKNRLDRLSCSRIVVFSACCAEKLLPAYARFAAKASLSSSQALLYRNALDSVWNCVSSKNWNHATLVGLEQECLHAIPSPEIAREYQEPYAEDAGAAATFALRALLTCDSMNALWAARRVYEALDNFVICTVAGVESDEHLILAHPLIQDELNFQDEDLTLLEAVTQDGETNLFTELRKKSVARSKSIF